MLFYTFMVFVMSAGLALTLMRGLQAVMHFGWSNRQARRSFVSTLTYTPVIAIIGYYSANHLPAERWGVAAALGVAAAVLLLVTAKPQWPDAP